MKKIDEQTKNRAVAVLLTIVTVVLLIGLTYTFFTAAVSNTNNEKINTQTATMSLEFDDNDNGISGTLNLGQSIIKKFTLENTGTVDAYGKINWYNLVNTYLPNSLTWTLEQSATENGTYTTVGSGSVPTSTTATTKVLKNGLLVPVNTTYYYKLTITLNNLDIDQSSDISASMNSKFSLEKGSLTGADQIMNLVADANPASTNVITKTAPSGANCTNTLAYDGTTDNNLRYVGTNPCNYVTFNGETAGWRIVGIMNNVDDGTGVTETRIKLIRTDSLGLYSWDTSDSTVNSGNGVNDWTQADLKNELNGDYLNTSLNSNTNWYNGKSNAQTEVFDYTKRLSAGAQELIGDAKWNLGGFSNTVGNLIPSTMYTLERGTTVLSGRPTSWTGKVALPYPSDYAYATAGGNTTSRSSCIGTLSLYESVSEETWYNNNYDCGNNNWIDISGWIWLLSPISNGASGAFGVRNGNYAKGNATYNRCFVFPTVYLKSSVSISGGNGIQSEPYQIG